MLRRCTAQFILFTHFFPQERQSGLSGSGAAVAAGRAKQLYEGSVERQFFFCYAVIAEDKEKSFPMSEMVSNAHSTATITYFLNRLSEAFKNITHARLMPPVVVTDFSWALIHASLAAFSQTSLNKYLKEAWAH